MAIVATKQFEKKKTRNSKSEGNDGSTKVDLENARVQYATAVTKLDAAEQELKKICKEYNASVEAKNLAIEQAAEAENSSKANMGRYSELSKEIATLQELVQQAKLASTQAREEEAKIYVDFDMFKKNLETRLTGTMSKIEALQKEIEKVRASDLNYGRTITL
ncbi:WEB family protein [Forsythia ovata]|uniref:WEB family protein n=1 Tax=Forsythia ovata TaxID=205694 RepID=A0ABD1SIW1_9LAMI